MMGSLIVRDIEDEVEAAIRLRAARRGVSMESEARDILRRAAFEAMPPREGPADAEVRIARILAFGQPPLEPFDLKAFSDALSDGTE